MKETIKKKVNKIKERQYADGLFQAQANSDWTMRDAPKILPTEDQLQELAENLTWENWQKESRKLPRKSRVLEVPWHIEDVYNIREDLPPLQCAEVLEAVGDHHDAEIGVNWEVLSFWAEELFPEKE